MKLHPIFSALTRHKVSVLLVAAQIALTLAVVSNAIHLMADRIQRVDRPTGMQEDGLYLITQSWVKAPSGNTLDELAMLDAMQREDVATLRAVPGVQSVTSTNSLPLLNSTRIGHLKIDPDTKQSVRSALYFVDEQGLATLGLKLLSGRPFKAVDVEARSISTQTPPNIVIITRDLETRLFGEGAAVGRSVYLNGQTRPSTVVGVIDRLQVPGTGSWATEIAYNSVLVPARLDQDFSRYAVRLKPGSDERPIELAKDALLRANGMRVINAEDVQTFAEIKSAAYRSDIGMVVILVTICLILLLVTAAGIFALGSFWVIQRRRQIGMRRALGARRTDILRQFLAENLIISLLGGLAGVCLSVYSSVLLMGHFEMEAMPGGYLLIGVVLVICVGQAATYIPARRASMIEPMEATRG